MDLEGPQGQFLPLLGSLHNQIAFEICEGDKDGEDNRLVDVFSITPRIRTLILIPF